MTQQHTVRCQRRPGSHNRASSIVCCCPPARSDVGESYVPWVKGHDAYLIPHVNSVNVASGFNGGDPRVMRETVAHARE